jgi:hypothetical protein
MEYFISELKLVKLKYMDFKIFDVLENRNNWQTCSTVSPVGRFWLASRVSESFKQFRSIIKVPIVRKCGSLS